MEKQSIEQMVTEYKLTNCDQTFRSLYEAIKADILNDNCMRSFVRKTGIEADTLLELFDRAVIYALDHFRAGHTFTKLVSLKFKQLRIDYHRTSNSGIARLIDSPPVTYDEDGKEIQFEIGDDFDLEDSVIKHIHAKKKAEQRQLIDFLLCGEDARATAIAQAYLTTEYDNPTAIGKHLGLDHKQVTRALSRLAAKFNTKQFGDYHDYLVAL